MIKLILQRRGNRDSNYFTKQNQIRGKIRFKQHKIMRQHSGKKSIFINQNFALKK